MNEKKMHKNAHRCAFFSRVCVNTLCIFVMYVRVKEKTRDSDRHSVKAKT